MPNVTRADMQSVSLPGYRTSSLFGPEFLLLSPMCDKRLFMPFLKRLTGLFRKDNLQASFEEKIMSKLLVVVRKRLPLK
jgi:hypothetical protein